MNEQAVESKRGGEGGAPQRMGRSIGFFGLLTLGIGCMFGTSWLLLTSSWLTKAGGPVNVELALLLCLIVELPLVFAYLEAIPMFPLSGGEMVYSYMAMGKFGGFMAAWAGILMNGVIFCWETLAVTKIVNYLFPQLAAFPPLWEILGVGVTLPSIVVGVVLALGIVAIQFNGGSFAAGISKVLTSVIIVLVIVGVVAALANMNPEYLAVPQTKAPVEGSLSLLAILTFTIAGWETVAKSAGEAKPQVRSKAGLALLLCLVICIVLNGLVVLAVCGIMPWTDAVNSSMPFADAIVAATGIPALSVVLLVAALVGVVGVSNATLYNATRMMYGLSDVGLIHPAFKKLGGKKKCPVNCIIFFGIFGVATPFLGSGVFLPLVDVVAVCTIAMWVMTFFSVIIMRKKYPHLARPVKMPGGKATMVIGSVFSVVLVGTVLLPFSPGAIIWPLEYILTAALFVLGIVLYQFRDKSIDTDRQREQILGEAAEAE